ncbi:MAG: hypothetical protein ABI390_10985, partial [Daejeonella sp.]
TDLFSANLRKMYKAKYLSPMIPSFDIEKTVSFFIDFLDFEVARDDKTYFILYKDELTLHILRAGSEIGQMEFYLEVDDIEQVWTKMKDKLEGIVVEEPFNREYGMREVHIIIPATKTLMFIGQEIN